MMSISRFKIRILALITLSSILTLLLFMLASKPFPGIFGQGKEEPFNYIRLPVWGETYSSQAFQLSEPLQKSSMEFDLFLNDRSMIETGLISVGRKSPYRGEFRFRVYRKSGLRRKLLMEKIGKPRPYELATFRIEDREIDRPGKLKLVMELEAMDKNASGGSHAHEDFAYLAPIVFDRRGMSELNVILVSLDTLPAGHLGCYGYDRPTSPNIDEFARQGVVLTQAISQSSWTTPAHQSLFTSLYPSAHQNERSWENQDFHYSQQTLANTLKENGYYTIAITGGGSVSSLFGFANGFNIYKEYCSVSNTTSPNRPIAHEDDTKKTFDFALKWLEENAGVKFFMFLHTFEPHDPYEDAFFNPDGSLESLIERRIALHDGDIRVADFYFGKLIGKLRSLDLMDNTIIVLLSDHGEEFYEHYRESDIRPQYQLPIIPEISLVDHGHSLYDELLLVPLIFRIPNLEPAKRVVDNQVRLIDVLPTVLDVLNIDHKAPMQGESLVGLLRTGTRESDPPALSESTYQGPERKSIRKDGYKYIWIRDTAEIKHEFTFRDLSRHELFDLVNDPKETTNIYDENKELAREYHRILLEQLESSRAIYDQLRADYRPGAFKGSEVNQDVIDALKGLGYLR